MSGTAVVILNYRTPTLTVDCLRSLAIVREESRACSAVVVDNASGDESQHQVERAIADESWENWVSLTVAAKNLGFAGGNNLGLRKTLQAAPRPDYLLMLNSDTIIHAGALAHCQRVMESERDIGIMSCRVLNSDGSIQNVTRSFPQPLRLSLCAAGLPWRWPRLFGWANPNDVSDALLNTKRDCDWIGGAFMFIRRAALEQVGLLDDDFFFYGEDIEFCWRFHKAGWRVHYDPGAAITHLGAGSSDPSRLPSAMRSQHHWRARYLVQRKCYGRLAERWIRSVDRVVLSMRKRKLAWQGRMASDDYHGLCRSLEILRSPETRA